MAEVTRRKLFKVLAGVVALTLVPMKVLGKALLPLPSPLTVAQIIAVSWPTVLQEMREGRDWASPELQAATDRGDIIIVTLGEMVEYNRKLYEIEELRTPLVWSHSDEVKNPRENQKINLVGNMLVNVVQSHEFMLEEKLVPGKRLVVSRHYRCNRGEHLITANKQYHFIHFHTAFCVIPDGRKASQV